MQYNDKELTSKAKVQVLICLNIGFICILFTLAIVWYWWRMRVLCKQFLVLVKLSYDVSATLAGVFLKAWTGYAKREPYQTEPT